MALLEKGIEFTLTLEVKIYKNEKKWYKINSKHFTKIEKYFLKIDPYHKSFIVIKNNQINPFFDFDTAWTFFQVNGIKFDSTKWPAGIYEIKSRITGESYHLYFPLDVIYRKFVSKIDFSSDWKVINFENK